MPKVEGCGVGDRLPEIKYGECNSTTTKHVYNESENFIESCAVHLDLRGPLNLDEMVPVIGKEGMVSRACLQATKISATQYQHRIGPACRICIEHCATNATLLLLSAYH